MRDTDRSGGSTSGPSTRSWRVVVAILAYLALVPIGFLFWKTFVVDGELTLASFRDAYSAIGLGEMALNSFLFTLGTTPIAVGIGTALAYLVLRTDLPGRRAVGALTLVHLLVPGVLYTISWIFLASPRTGLLNRALEPVAGPRPSTSSGSAGWCSSRDSISCRSSSS